MDSTPFAFELLNCIAELWTPGATPHTALGWLTVSTYAVAALACFGASRVRIRDKSFWSAAGTGMLLLGIFGHLDLFAALGAVGRCSVQDPAWFEVWRAIEGMALGVVLCGLTALAFLTAVNMRRRLRRVGPALAGSALLLAYLFAAASMVRSASTLSGSEAWVLGGLQLAGAALVLSNAAFAVQTRRKPQNTPTALRQG